VSLPGGGQNATWRRLSARMLLVHPVRELGQAVPALLGLFVAGRAMGNGQMWWLAPLAVAAVLTLSVLRWVTTTYRITPEQVQLRTGLLQRKTISTPADRVRSVHVTASALHRVLGLAKVEIGTGSHDPGSGLSLDSLGAAEAAGLRAELLHRSAVASPDLQDAGAPGGAPVAGAAAGCDRDTRPPAYGERDLNGRPVHGQPDQEAVLARLDLRWVRFAPFTMSGVLGAAAIIGIGSRLLDQLGVSAGDVGPIRRGLDYVERNPIWLDVIQGLVALLALVTVLSVGGYVLSYWGFRLTRHPGGSLHITRGLLTTRATSVEERRLRGVELAEPLLQRAVHAARLSGITTGLKARSGADGGSSMLLPPAPRAVAREVAGKVLRDPAPVDVPLVAHGPAARRRRLTRALLGALLLIGAAGVAAAAGASPWLTAVVAVLTVPVAFMLAADRYRSLGHAIAGRYLVTRAGSLYRRRDVLECDGIIGWNLRQTFFQRRAGLVTLTATTAAGRQRYAVTDLPLTMAMPLADRALPGLWDEFLVSQTSETPGGS
jgi:putative membrane protein